MKKTKTSQDSLAVLRRKAEKKLGNRSKAAETLSAIEAQRLIQELGTHQIELEMQNEELRRAQAELEESRSRYVELYDFAPVGYFTIDRHGSIREANLTGAQLLGVGSHSLVNAHFAGFLASDDDKRTYRRHVKEASDTRVRQTCEVRLRKRGGPPFYAQLQSIVVEQGGEAAGSIRTAVIDIEDRRVLEDALRAAHGELEVRVKDRTDELAEAAESIELFQGLIEQTNDAIFLLDVSSGRFVDFNTSACKLLGYTREEMSRLGVTDVTVHISDRATWMERVRVLKEKVYRVSETEVRRKNGSKIIIELSSRYIVQGGREYIITVARDIMARKETENVLNATNALLREFAKQSLRKEYLDAVVDIIGDWSGCRYVGIRIKDRTGHIPYEAYRGFSREFWESENMILLKENQCVCSRVMSGAIEAQDKPAMSPGGSFYSGNTMKFIEGMSDREQSRYRGVCIRNGFTSLAIVPLRHRGSVLGAIHLADEREGMVSPKSVEFIETMTTLIGEAVNRFDMEDDLRNNYNALRESSELMSQMFSNIHIHIAYMDPGFNFIRVNRKYAEAHGQDPNFFVGKNHFDLYPHRENESIFRRVVENGEPYSVFEKPFTYTEQPERGTTYWDWSLQPVKDAEEKVVGLVLSLVDVTERRRAETERELLVAAVEAAAEAVVITDLRGNIEYVNPAFEQITGYGSMEILGGDLHILDSGHHGRDFYEQLREELRRNGVWRGILVNRRKDGTLYHEDCTYAPVRDADGEVVNYVSIKRDVTEKMRLESIAQAVDTMNSIGFIFSGIRHEIGNPVNSVNMILGVLKAKLGGLSQDAIREYVDRALGQMGRVEYLLKSLKNFNLYETPDIQAVELTSFLDKFLSLVSEDLQKKGIAVDAAVSSGAEQVAADPRALQQLLLNVLTNASDALEGRERPSVAISASNAGGLIRIRVQDNGSGMSREEQERLFTPFYTTKEKGTGLGLVIVKKMIARMHGTVAVESRKGEGTTIDIFLPEVLRERTELETNTTDH
ncbi:MAG: hypothetical protein A2X56_12895 [Nitrospirae bacterium GWC2_57_13]|nr:MAG: hypothetical protein A2X56_12895 [Nitrospirae bacterium GWC2_57_13]